MKLFEAWYTFKGILLLGSYIYVRVSLSCCAESLDLPKSLFLPSMDMCVSMVGILSGSTQSDATTLCSILVYNLVCYMLVYMVVEEQFSQCHFSGPSLGVRSLF